MSVLRLDGCGALVSASCAVHCVIASVAPFLFAGVAFLHSERVEWALSATALVFGLLSGFAAYRAKRSPWLLGLFAAGLMLVLTGRVAEEALGNGGLAITGGVSLAVAHLLHLRIAASANRSAESAESIQSVKSTRQASGSLNLLND